MKSKLLSLISYGIIGFALVSTVWTNIPELQALFPEYTSQISAFINAPASIVAGVGLGVQSYISKSRLNDTAMYQGLVESYNNIKTSYSEVQSSAKQTISELTNRYQEIKSGYESMKRSTEELVKLVRIDLEAKLSNPLIDEKVAELIKGVLE